MLISIIIITLNESQYLKPCISACRTASLLDSKRSVPLEIIVSDGGSRDRTIQIAEKFSDKVVQTAGGRYKQLNLGTSASSGDILVFLHADTLLPRDAILQILYELKDPTVIGGGFKKVWRWTPHVKCSRLVNFLMYFWEGFGNWTVHLIKNFPGDNAIFVRRHIFQKLDGFRPLWICEDFDFSRRLSKLKGQVVYIRSPVKTSARRFEKYGFLKTLFQWFFIYWFWRGGVSQKLLHRWFSTYYAIAPKSNNYLGF